MKLPKQSYTEEFKELAVKRVTPEQMEFSRMRAENARLKMEFAILKKRQARSACVQSVDEVL